MVDYNEQISTDIAEDHTHCIDLNALQCTVSQLIRTSPPSSPSDYGTPPTSPSAVSIMVSFSPNVETFNAETSHESRQYGSALSNTKRYRIHVGTRPGFCKPELFTYEQSQQQHKQLIDLLQQCLSLIENLQFKIPLIHAFSKTPDWSLEPYACVVFESCSRELAEGVAAIIGRIFQQDAIGIFDDDADPAHRFFAISCLSGAPIPENDALAMMVAITDKYPLLSVQFGETTATIELHDFDDTYNATTIADLQQIVDNRDCLYQINESSVKSSLLEEPHYRKAIKNAGFQLLEKVIEAVRSQDNLFPNCN